MKGRGEVGEVLHISRSGRMIIKSSSRNAAALSRGTLLVDAKGRSVARVVELIGPVDSPYISALPLTDRVKKYIGARLYAAGPDSSSNRDMRRHEGKGVERESKKNSKREDGEDGEG